MIIAVLALALVSGLLIGCIGIGGVLLVPILSLMGIDVHAAIAASMFGYLFSGLIGTWLYARKASIDWPSALWLPPPPPPAGPPRAAPPPPPPRRRPPPLA